MFDLPDFKNAVIGEAAAVESAEDKKIAFSKAHHGMMSGSSIGLIIIEPVSDAEIDAKQAEIDNSKTGKTATKEKELAVLKRALEKMLNGDFSQTAKSYLDEIVSQRRRVFNPERPKAFSGNKHTEWGNGKELEAIAAYEDLTGLKLEKTGDSQEFVRLGYVESVDFDFSEWFGCTPDSVTPESEAYAVKFIGRDIENIPREFKNPSSGVVFDRYRNLKTPADLKKENTLYYWQVIAQMACLNAPYAQWIAYDCDIKSDNPADKFVIVDFERDLIVEKALIDSLFKAVQYIQEII